MSALAALQDRFQRGLLEGDDIALTDIVDSEKPGRDVRFGVYRHAYSARLVEIVGQDFERLRMFLGDEAFDAAAHSYVKSTPSQHANARWYSRGLPDFLKIASPWKDAAELADLAILECALNDAFDAADDPVLEIGTLAALPASAWGKLQFRPHPSAAQIDLRTNAASIWVALRDERDPPAVTRSPSPIHLIVWRQGLVPKFREIPDEEAMMWNEAAAGVPFGVLCEMMSFRFDPEGAPLRAATMLQQWLTCGMLSGLR